MRRSERPEAAAGLRVGDAERDACIDRLRDAHAAGQLDVVEFSDRVGSALAARRVGELAVLLVDLPGQSVERVRRPARERRDHDRPATGAARWHSAPVPVRDRPGRAPVRVRRARLALLSVGAAAVLGLGGLGVAAAIGTASPPADQAGVEPAPEAAQELAMCGSSTVVPAADRICPAYRTVKKQADDADFAAEQAAAASGDDDPVARALVDEAASASQQATQAVVDLEGQLADAAASGGPIVAADADALVAVAARRVGAAARAAEQASASIEDHGSPG